MKFRELRLLVDENVSPRVTAFLRSCGMDLLDVKENGWFGKEDVELLEKAYEEGRFVLTHDSDFGALAVHAGKRCRGIIYIRSKNLHPDNVIMICGRLTGLGVEIKPGTIIIADEHKVRMREPGQ